MRGSLLDLVVDTSHSNHFEAQRLIDSLATGDADIEELLTLEPPPEFPSFSQDVLDRLKADFPGSPGYEYMIDRGFDDHTLDLYNIGYSSKNQMVSVPMHDAKGEPVGLIGRSIVGKSFKNSYRLPTSKTLWNIHRAKAKSDVVVVCEASFDAMRISQAGYPNVVACLGGNFSPYHADQLNRHFSTVIIMTDFDRLADHVYENCRLCRAKNLLQCEGHNPGRDLGETIAKKMRNKQILWASYEMGMVYPPGVKDAGDMTDDQIRTCVKNAVTNFTYNQWDLSVRYGILDTTGKQTTPK